MKYGVRSLALALLLSGPTTAALAEQQPQGGVHDKRIMSYDFYEDDVYTIDAYTGYIATVNFDESEQVIDWRIGETDTWEIRFTSFPNRISIKARNAVKQPTNLTIWTTRREYTILLTARKGAAPKNVGFRYSFKYPEPVVTEVTARSIFEVHRNANGSVNLDYSAAGSNLLRPVQVFDDGVKTYIRLPPRSVRPSVFAMEIDGLERTINTGDYLDDGTIVVNGVFSRLVLRNGPYVICLFNRPLYQTALENAPEKPKRRDTEIENNPGSGR